MLAAVLTALAVLLWPARRPDRCPGEGSVATRSVLSRVRPRRRVTSEDWVADLAEVVSVGLRAGLDLRSALAVAAGTPSVRAAAPWLSARVEGAADGAPVAALTPDPSCSAPERADLAVLARAWTVSESSGAGAAGTTAAAARAVRERTADRQRLEAALAGPRASMRMLTALPALGPLLVLLVGLDPAEVYGVRAAQAAVAVGVVLTALGWLWSRALVRRAQQPRTTASGSR